MTELTQTEAEEIYHLIRSQIGRRRLRFAGRTRSSEDGEEALHHLFLLMYERVRKHWIRSQPLERYVAASIPRELLKFRAREWRNEIPQSKGEPHEI